jgi:hypothetical protein
MSVAPRHRRARALPRAAVSAACIAAGGCTPGGEASKGPPAVALPPVPSAEVAPKRREPSLPELAAPRAVACTFAEPHFAGSLRLRADAPAAVQVRNASARVRIPQEPRGGVWVEVAHDTIALAAWMRADELSLFAARPLVFGGWLSVKGDVPLRWRAYRSTSLWIAPPRPTGVRSFERAERRTACDEVSLSRSFFDAQAPFALGPRKDRGLLDTTWSTRLRAEPTGNEVGAIEAAGPIEVDVYERETDRARVAFSLDQAVVVAWVDAGVVKPAPPAGGTRRVRPPTFRGDVARVEPMGELVTCNFALEVAVEAGDERALVGSAAAGTTIKVVGREGELAHVELPDASPWIALERGARWITQASALASGDGSERRCVPVR